MEHPAGRFQRWVFELSILGLFLYVVTEAAVNANSNLTPEEEKEFLDRHNDLRRAQVKIHGGQNMNELVSCIPIIYSFRENIYRGAFGSPMAFSGRWRLFFCIYFHEFIYSYLFIFQILTL